MAHADCMVYITQAELQQLVGKDASGIGKTKEGMVCVDSPQTHGPGVEDGLVAKAAQAGVAMHNIDALAQDDVAKDGEEGKDGGKAGGPVDDEEGNMVDLESIGEIAHAGAALVSVSDDDDLVAPVPEFG